MARFLNGISCFISGSAVFFTGCSNQMNDNSFQLMSHTTQNVTLTSASEPVSFNAESGNCATNLPTAMINNDYCFNEIPVAQVQINASSSELFSVCVATHLVGAAQNAAVLVVSDRGAIEGEGFSNGDSEVLATFSGAGRYKIFVGFPQNSGVQKVKVLAGRTTSFQVASPACSLR
ncbi:hypothetical protein EBU99_12995 [bacterium]|nr:hypothetical protein [bacterium]